MEDGEMADKKGESKWWEQERKSPVTPYVEIDPKNRRLGIEGGISGVLESAVPRGLGAVKRAARALGEASAAGMAVATGGGIEDPRKPVPSKKVVQQQPQAAPAAAPQAPAITTPNPSPPQQPAWGGLYNVTGNERQEGFANPYEAPSSGPGVAGGYFDEAKWAEAAKQLQSIIRGDNPRMQTVYRYSPGMGKYSVEEAMPQSEATKRAAMAHLFGMFPERLKADVGLQEAELRGKYGVAEAGVRAQEAEEYKRAQLNLQREAMDRDDAREKRKLWTGYGIRKVVNPETLQEEEVFDTERARRLTAQAYGEPEPARKINMPQVMAKIKNDVNTYGEKGRRANIDKLLEDPNITLDFLEGNEQFMSDRRNAGYLKELRKKQATK